MMLRFLVAFIATLILGCSSDPSTSLDTNPSDTTQTTDTTTFSDTTQVDTTKTGNVLVGRFDGDTAESGNCIWVAPYHRSDGTCVRGHWRSASGKKCSLVGSVYVECD